MKKKEPKYTQEFKELIELAIDEHIHIAELRLKSADNNSITYEYRADHNNSHNFPCFPFFCPLYHACQFFQHDYPASTRADPWTGVFLKLKGFHA